MKKRLIKILLLVIVFAFAVFLLKITNIDNYTLSKKVALLINNENRIDVANSFKSYEFTQLPQIVKKYLQRTIKNKTVSPIVSNIKLVGNTKNNPKSEWVETNSTIYYSTTEPGFVEMSLSSGYPLFGNKKIDSYINNTASTNTNFLSVIPLSNFSGHKLNRSYIVLYLMESVFSPTVLLPTMNVGWKKIGNSSAMATIWHNQLKGSAVFYFNSINEVTKIVSKYRYMPGKLDYTEETCTMHLANYKNVGNYYIPTYFEFQWNLAGGDFTFARFQITDITYEYNTNFLEKTNE